MITESFDNNSAPVISPEKFYQRGSIAEKCILTFSHKVFDYVKKNFDLKHECSSETANGKIKIYSFLHNSEKILFYMSPIGSAVAATVMDEVHWLTGVVKFIVFGSCGVITEEDVSGKIIVPTEAFRDEGFSYHYAEPSCFIVIEKAESMIRFFDKCSIPYISGKTWTTDAIYMETENKIKARKEVGCICVEMECSGLQALCNYRGLALYPFFFVSDLVSTSVWKNINLGTEEEKKEQLNCFDIALRLCTET